MPAVADQPDATALDVPMTEGDFPSRRWVALAIMVVAGYMDLLDASIVNVAIPSIRDSLDASYAHIQWIVAGYLLALAVGLITGGRLGDIYGRKRVFIAGVFAFGLTSLLSGLAPSAGALVVSRLLQGLSAAVMIPQIFAVVQVSFPRREQARALGLYSTVAGVAVMSGALLAGVLLDVAHWSWRSIFLINVPVSVLVGVTAIAVLPESRSPRTSSLDPGGVALGSTALFALVFGLIEGRQLGWPMWTLVLIAAAAPIAVGFVRYEGAHERRGHEPLVSIGLLAQREVWSGIVVVVVFFTGLVGFFLAFTVFLQLGLGWTPLQSALTTFPSSVGLALAAQLSGRFAQRLGTRLLAVGALVMAGAQAALIAVVRAHGPDLTPWQVRPVLLVFGIGMGLIVPPLADVILGGVAERHAGAASGLVNTGMQVGNAVGVAVVGVILFSALAAQAPRSAAEVGPQLTRQLTAAGVAAPLRDQEVAEFEHCLVDRLRQEDPAATPASCRTESSAVPLPGRHVLRGIFDAAATRARATAFTGSIQRALAFEVGVFILTTALLTLLPFHGRPRPTRRKSGRHRMSRRQRPRASGRAPRQRTEASRHHGGARRAADAQS
jgi:EmrB/QacA subfamily drug resistance transporter